MLTIARVALRDTCEVISSPRSSFLRATGRLELKRHLQI